MRRRVIFPLLALLTVLGGYLIGCATGSGQPHMNAAVAQLREARGELEAAVSDKGGHREKAIALIDEAITEVQAGIDFAASH